MILVIFYSILLVIGMLVSQFIDLTAIAEIVHTVTMVFLSYIMVEVGLQFTINKDSLRSYAWDYIVAATAAGFPWIFCAIYFIIFFQMDWPESLLFARFAAPTSAGVLFAMLTAAGLGTTWLFKKARILAIFDDLDTILFMIPLQMMLIGFKKELLIVFFLIAIILICAYRWLHVLHWPVGKLYFLIYGIVVVFTNDLMEHVIHLRLEVLLPAFAFGCLLYNPNNSTYMKGDRDEHTSSKFIRRGSLVLDRFVKGGFMLLVGCSLPKIEMSSIPAAMIVLHVIIITILINLGKCFPSFCYRREVPLKERIALSIAMFPRGEVGAGVLVIAMSYGIGGLPVTLAVLCLALNLLLTGVFIYIVNWLIRPKEQDLATAKTKSHGS